MKALFEAEKNSLGGNAVNQDYPAGGAFCVRDRLLMYLSGMGVDAVESLELATECLRRAGADCDCRAAMDVLEEVLAKGGHARPGEERELRSRCAPPLVRSSMLACDLSSRSLPGLARAVAGKCLGAVPFRSMPWSKM